MMTSKGWWWKNKKSLSLGRLKQQFKLKISEMKKLIVKISKNRPKRRRSVFLHKEWKKRSLSLRKKKFLMEVYLQLSKFTRTLSRLSKFLKEIKKTNLKSNKILIKIIMKSTTKIGKLFPKCLNKKSTQLLPTWNQQWSQKHWKNYKTKKIYWKLRRLKKFKMR